MSNGVDRGDGGSGTRPGSRPLARVAGRGFPAAASRATVLDRSVEVLLAGEDLDLSRLAETIGVARRTLYRWFGDRAGLLGEALWVLTDRAWIHARLSTPGTGTPHVVGVLGCFLASVRASQPADTLMSREPRLAVAAIMSPTGSVQRRAVARTDQLLADHTDLTERERRAMAEILTQVAMTYVWAQLLTGTEADLDTPLAITRRLLLPSR